MVTPVRSDRGARHRGVAETADEMTDEERGSCWWYHSDCGGGALLDILCYGCYFSRWYFGLPLGVSASEQRLSLSYADCGDNAAAIFRYADRLTVAEGSWTIPRRLVPAGPQLLCEDGALWCSGGADSNQSVEAWHTRGRGCGRSRIRAFGRYAKSAVALRGTPAAR